MSMNQLRQAQLVALPERDYGRKARNRFELVCWLAIAADLLVVFTSRPQSLPSAQASSIFKTPAAEIAPQACRPVIDQIVEYRQR